MTKIFISYSSADRSTIEKVDSFLTRTYRVWYDKKSLIGGQKWWDEIIRQIDECEIVLYFSSTKSNNSKWCIKEVDYAISQEKIIIPIRLEDVLLPEVLHDIHAVSMFEGFNKITRRDLVLSINQFINGSGLNNNQYESDFAHLELLSKHFADELFQKLESDLGLSRVEQELHWTITDHYFGSIDTYMDRIFNLEIRFAIEDYNNSALNFSVAFSKVSSMGKHDQTHFNLAPRKEIDRNRWRENHRNMMSSFYELQKARKFLIKNVQAHHPEFIMSK